MGDAMRDLLTRGQQAKPRHPPRKEFGRSRQDDERESMVAANLDEEDPVDERRRAPMRAVECDEPPLSMPTAARELSLEDDDDDLQVHDARTTSIILGRPEI